MSSSPKPGTGEPGHPPAGRSARDELPWPEGWTRPGAASWVGFGCFAGLGLLIAAGGIGSGLAGYLPALQAAAAAGLGIGLGAVSGNLYPGRRRGRVERDTSAGESAGRAGESAEGGVIFRYSLVRSLSVAVAAAGPGTAFLAAGIPAPGAIRLIALLAGVFFVAAAVALAVRIVAQRWSVTLTPSGATVRSGTARAEVRWDAVTAVLAKESTGYLAGIPVRSRFIGITADGFVTLPGGSAGRLIRRLNRALGTDVPVPLRTIAVEPELLFHAVRYYHEHPDARAELGSAAGVARITEGRLTGGATDVASG